MRSRNVTAFLFSNMHDDYLPALTHARSMGSVPYGGRYRLIDFPLSNLTNAGISKVGIITKNNYYSLMDHIGSGKAWDLYRKNEGLFFLPPNTQSDEMYSGRIASLYQSRYFIKNSADEYVIMADCNVVGSIDYEKFMAAHLSSGADITLAYKDCDSPDMSDNLTLRVDDDNRVADVMVGKCSGDGCKNSLGLMMMRADLLLRLLEDCVSRHQMNFNLDILQKNLHTLDIRGYEVAEYVDIICSVESFYKSNMSLFDSEIRDAIFRKDRPVYTKVRDAAPARYGLKSTAANSLIADGCYIEGDVQNSIIFRDVHVGRDAAVKNSIIMQGAVICEGADLNGTILDKNVVIRSGRILSGAETFPFFVNKGCIV